MCVYIIKKRVCVCEGCLNKYISVITWLSQTKIPSSTPVWANFALGSNSVRGKAWPNISCEGIRTSEDDQPRNG